MNDAAPTVASIVAALLAATPEPPDGIASDVHGELEAGPDPETVLDATTAILDATAPLVAALREALGEARLPAELAADAEILHDRTRRWLALAEDARRQTGDSLRAIACARSYQAHR